MSSDLNFSFIGGNISDLKKNKKQRKQLYKLKKK